MLSSSALIAGVGLLLLSFPAAAHNEGSLAENPWFNWPISLDFIIPFSVVIFLYHRGRVRRNNRNTASASRKEVLLFGFGLLAIFLALQSPIDPLAEQSVLMHQVQHVLLRSLGPMLFFLALPQAALVAGLSSRGRRFIGRLGRTAGMGGLGLISHPVSVTILFIASAYVWQYPPYFELALHNDAVHYVMHVTMLGAGLLFWWRIFDHRGSGTSYGVRLAMLWAATTANIALGAYLTLKGSVLYPAYDELGRLWFTAHVDELLGGLIVWILGSKMMLVGFLVIIRRWGYNDTLPRQHKPVSATNSGSSHGMLQTEDRKERSARTALMLGFFSGGVFLTFMAMVSFYLVVR